MTQSTFPLIQQTPLATTGGPSLRKQYPQEPDAWDLEAGEYYFQKFKPEVLDSLKANAIHPTLYHAYANNKGIDPNGLQGQKLGASIKSFLQGVDETEKECLRYINDGKIKQIQELEKYKETTGYLLYDFAQPYVVGAIAVGGVGFSMLGKLARIVNKARKEKTLDLMRGDAINYLFQKKNSLVGFLGKVWNASLKQIGQKLVSKSLWKGVVSSFVHVIKKNPLTLILSSATMLGFEIIKRHNPNGVLEKTADGFNSFARSLDPSDDYVRDVDAIEKAHALAQQRAVSVKLEETDCISGCTKEGQLHNYNKFIEKLGYPSDTTQLVANDLAYADEGFLVGEVFSGKDAPQIAQELSKTNFPLKAPVISVDPNLMQTIAMINLGVNKFGTLSYEINPYYQLDDEKSFQWRLMDEKNGGDCEDHALTKKNELMKLGIPGTVLRIAGVRAEDDKYGIADHAILIMRTTEGDLVLDNLRHEILPLEKTKYRIFNLQNANHKTFSTF